MSEALRHTPYSSQRQLNSDLQVNLGGNISVSLDPSLSPNYGNRPHPLYSADTFSATPQDGSPLYGDIKDPLFNEKTKSSSRLNVVSPQRQDPESVRNMLVNQLNKNLKLISIYKDTLNKEEESRAAESRVPISKLSSNDATKLVKKLVGVQPKKIHSMSPGRIVQEKLKYALENLSPAPLLKKQQENQKKVSVGPERKGISSLLPSNERRIDIPSGDSRLISETSNNFVLFNKLTESSIHFIPNFQRKKGGLRNIKLNLPERDAYSVGGARQKRANRVLMDAELKVHRLEQKYQRGRNIQSSSSDNRVEKSVNNIALNEMQFSGRDERAQQRLGAIEEVGSVPQSFQLDPAWKKFLANNSKGSYEPYSMNQDSVTAQSGNQGSLAGSMRPHSYMMPRLKNQDRIQGTFLQQPKMLQTSLQEDYDSSWFPQTDLSIVDLNKQQREMQKKEMAAKRRMETSPQGFRAVYKQNPRKNKMKMLMSLNASDTRVLKKRTPKQRIPQTLEHHVLSNSNFTDEQSYGLPVSVSTLGDLKATLQERAPPEFAQEYLNSTQPRQHLISGSSIMQANSVVMNTRRPESRGSTVDKIFKEKTLFPQEQIDEPCPTIVGSQSIHSTAAQHTKTLLNVKQHREAVDPPIWREGYTSPNQWLQLAADGTLPAYKYEDSIYRKKPAFRAIAKQIERRYKEQMKEMNSPVKYLSPLKGQKATSKSISKENKEKDKHREYIMKKSPNQRVSNFQLYVAEAHNSLIQNAMENEAKLNSESRKTIDIQVPQEQPLTNKSIHEMSLIQANPQSARILSEKNLKENNQIQTKSHENLQKKQGQQMPELFPLKKTLKFDGFSFKDPLPKRAHESILKGLDKAERVKKQKIARLIREGGIGTKKLGEQRGEEEVRRNVSNLHRNYYKFF